MSTRLPRSNPEGFYQVDLSPWEEHKTGRPRVKFVVTRDDEVAVGLSLTEQETDDLIVMLQYYRQEVFGGTA